MPPGYSETPLWKKLGVRSGDRLLLLDPPRNWSVPDLPPGVTSIAEAGEDRGQAPAEIILAFFPSLARLHERIPLLAPRVFPAGAIWAAWPRRAAGHERDIREQDIRSVALPLGLVDVKVAALDEDWSGLRLVWRRARRDAPDATPG
ncbi:MAG: DUF3052 domain-containing protein [Solirubrobacteraceae bacterium]|jgi:hypothetical protein